MSHTWSPRALCALTAVGMLFAVGTIEAANCGDSLGVACKCGDTVVGAHTLDDTDPVVSTGAADLCTTSFGLRLAADATLDGTGKTIRAAGSSNGATAGIDFLGCGAVVSNLTVEGWGNGFRVENRDCRNNGTACSTAAGATTKPNRLQNVTARNNGLAPNGYGFKINDSQCVTVRGASALNAGDEGIHLGGSHRVTMEQLPNPYCGPRKIVIKDSWQENLYVLNGTLNSIRDVVSGYPAGCAGSGRNCIGLHLEGQDGSTSSANTIAASTFTEYGIKLTGDADSNTIGQNGEGLGVTTPRVEFESRRGTSPRRPNGNTLANVTVNGTGNECIVFSTTGSGTMAYHPYSNTGSGVLNDCAPEVDTSDTTRDAQPTNDLCGFTCPPDGECNETESGNDSGIGDHGVARFRRAGGEFECP